MPRKHVRLRMIDKFAFDDTSRVSRSTERMLTIDGSLRAKQINKLSEDFSLNDLLCWRNGNVTKVAGRFDFIYIYIFILLEIVQYNLYVTRK